MSVETNRVLLAGMVVPFRVVVELDERVVKAPVEGVPAPTAALSTVPPFMSAVVRTAEGMVTTPVLSAIVAAAVPSLAFMFVTSTFVASSVVAFTAVAFTVVMFPVVAVAVVNVPAAGVAPPTTVCVI
jgi:hypothetical protein